MKTGITVFKSELDLKAVLAKEYMKQIENLFGDKNLALEFLTNVVSSVQRVPKLLECTQDSLLNGFMTMASLKLMPSGVSGEAYVLPYENRKTGTCEAQFQLGYQGLITLLYRAGAKDIVCELVRSHDKFSLSRGKINHEIDPLKNAADRGKVVGAYAIITLSTGGTVEQFMHIDDIFAHAKKFSKSYGSSFSPWNAESDPQGWMPRKTILKQTAKLAYKNPALNIALAEDNKDSNIHERKELPAPTVDYSNFEELLRSAKSLEGLEYTWADIPADAKAKLKPVFEEMKAMIQTEAKDIV